MSTIPQPLSMMETVSNAAVHVCILLQHSTVQYVHALQYSVSGVSRIGRPQALECGSSIRKFRRPSSWICEDAGPWPTPVELGQGGRRTMGAAMTAQRPHARRHGSASRDSLLTSLRSAPPSQQGPLFRNSLTCFLRVGASDARRVPRRVFLEEGWDSFQETSPECKPGGVKRPRDSAEKHSEPPMRKLLWDREL